MQRQIFLFSSINTFSARDFIQQLMDFDRESNDEIVVFINSGGGTVTDMFAMIDVMNMVKSPIKTVVIGMAASAAAVIASAGDTRLITENSQMMIHEAWAMTGGSISAMQENVARMTKDQERLINIISTATGKDKDKILADIKKTDKYFDAAAAVRYGLADNVIKKGDLERFKLSEPVHVQAFEIDAGSSSDKLTDVQLLRTGVFESDQYGKIVITDDVLTKMKSNFDRNVRGIDISIDYTHDNDSGEKPAAYWIKRLEVRDSGEEKHLYALGEFTPEGLKLVQEKAYKYASVDFVVNYMTDKGEFVPYVLLGGTLTNRPVIKGMNPIKLSETKTEERRVRCMDKTALINELKNQGIDVVQIQNERDELNNKLMKLENDIKTLSKVPAEKDDEIKSLKAKIDDMTKYINDKAKDAAFNDLVKDGKVTPAQKEKVLAKFSSADEIVDFYKDAAAVVNMKPSGDGGDSKDSLTDPEQSLVNSGVFTKEEIINNRTNA